MTHRQGYGWYPAHDEYRGRILGHIRRIKPAFGVVMTEDYAPISEAWEAHPHAICARVWAIDDYNGDAGRALNADPRERRRIVAAIRGQDRAVASAGRRGQGVRSPMPAICTSRHGTSRTSTRAMPRSRAIISIAAWRHRPACSVSNQARRGASAELHADKTVDWDDFDDFGLRPSTRADTSRFMPISRQRGEPRRGLRLSCGAASGWPLDTPMVLDETGIDGEHF